MGNSGSSPHRSRSGSSGGNNGNGSIPQVPPVPVVAPPPHGYPGVHPPYQPPPGYPPYPTTQPYPAVGPWISNRPYPPPYPQFQGNGAWLASVPPSHYPRMPVPTPYPPPASAESQRTATIRNDVNLKRATLRLERDPENPGQHLVAFSFDATVAGSICVFFVAKEGENCSFTSVRPELYTPIRVPFEKGLGQKFRQAPGAGVDLKRFLEAELTSEGQKEQYPLVVRTETVPKDPPPDAPSREESPGAKLPKWVQSQTTYAVLEKHPDREYTVKVLKQKIWVDGMRYELQEIYGIEHGGGQSASDTGSDIGKECVICLSEPRDTTVLPCRHMCMCSECAKVLRYQTNRCPICRQVVERLLEIRVPGNKGLNATQSAGGEEGAQAQAQAQGSQPEGSEGPVKGEGLDESKEGPAR